MEFKSQVGPPFGNNFNNRTEETIGSTTDIWTAYREGRLGSGPRPFLGYFFLPEDCPSVRRPVRNAQPNFPVDPAFANASCGRYELQLRRMVLERLYDATCLILATNAEPTDLRHISDDISDDISFGRFVATLRAAAYTFLQSQKQK